MLRPFLTCVTLTLACASTATAQTTQPFRPGDAAALFRDAILANPEDRDTVSYLARLLEKIGPDAVPVVEELWLKQHVGYREHAFQCLVNIQSNTLQGRDSGRDSRAFDALVRIVGNEKGDPGFRARAIPQLAQDTGTLQRLLLGPDSARRDDTYHAALLVAYRSFAVVEGTPAGDTLHDVAFEALYKSGPRVKSQAPTIRDLLTDPAMTDTEEKLHRVLLLVGQCGSEAAPLVPALKEMFADPKRPARIRHLAAHALTEIAKDTQRHE